MQLPDKIEKPKGVELYDFDDYKSLRGNIFNGIENAFKQSFPSSYGGVRIEVDNLRYEGPEDYDIDKQKQAILKNRFLTRKLKGTLRMYDEETGDQLDEIDTSLMKVPWLTPRNTFIHGGNEYSTIMQSRLLPGAYSRRQANGQLETQFNVRPGTGVGFRVGFEPDTAQYRLRISQANLHLYSLLKDLGTSDEDLKERWGEDILNANKKKYDARVFEKAYQRLVPPRLRDEEATHEEKAKAIQDAFDSATIHKAVVSRNMPGMLSQKRASEERAKWRGRDAAIKSASKALDEIPFTPDFTPSECSVNRLEFDFEKQAMLRFNDVTELNIELCEAIACIQNGPEEFEKMAAELSGVNNEAAGTAKRLGVGGLGGLGFTSLLLAVAGKSLGKYPNLSRALSQASRDSVDLLNPNVVKGMQKSMPDLAGVAGRQAEAIKPILESFSDKGLVGKATSLWEARKSLGDKLVPDIERFKGEHGEAPARTLAKALAMTLGGLGAGAGAVGAETSYRTNQLGDYIADKSTDFWNKEAKLDPLQTMLTAKAHSDKKEYKQKASLMAILMQERPEEFIIDQDDPQFPGVTHVPTSFKMHVPKAIIPEGVKYEYDYRDQDFTDDAGSYAVQDIYDLAKSKGEPQDLTLADMMHNMDYDEENEPEEEWPGSEVFAARAAKANLDKPIVAVDYDDGRWIADGVHRMWKANEAGNETIKGYVINQSDLEGIRKPLKKNYKISEIDDPAEDDEIAEKLMRKRLDLHNDDGDNVAFLTHHPDSDDPDNAAWMQGLYVDPKYRGEGLAKRLVSEFESRNEGKRLGLRARPFKDENLPVEDLIKMYQGMGYEIGDDENRMYKEPVEKAAKIKEVDGKWVITTSDGSRVLGTHETREKALAQERAIQASKRGR